MSSIDQTFISIDRRLTGIESELRLMRSDMTRFQDRLIQIGFGLVGVLCGAMVALVLALV
jgi:hypothetical protein